MRDKDASFNKEERLRGIKAVSGLFSSGSTCVIPPVRMIYRIMQAESSLHPVRILISVPVKNVRKAADRNLVRRRIREAYRKNKRPLITRVADRGKRIDMAIIWTDPVIQPYDVTERCIREIISWLMQHV